MRRALFASGSARITFWVLSIGFVAILLTSMFLYDIYLSNKLFTANRSAVAHDFVRAVRLAQVMDQSKLQQNVRWLHGRGFIIHFQPSPQPNTRTVNKLNNKALYKLVNKHYPNFRFNVPVPNGNWLVISSYHKSHPWLSSGFKLEFLLILICIVLLCYWAIKRTALPIDHLVSGAERFGRDVQAPPLAEQGSRDMRNLIRALNGMQLQIRRLITDRTQMLAAISHDLRTPITRLQLRIEYLEGTDQYQKARNDLNEMEQMIASILSFAKTHTTAERMERVDMVSLLESICNEQQDTGHQVEFGSQESRLVCLARITSLKRAFNNIITNAVKYAGSAEVSVEIEEKKAVIKIQDHGMGIPSTELENVFEPFYRLDQARTPKRSGSGLGLAVTRDIIRSHGGEIKLFNTENPQGLLVKVILPLASK